MLQMYEVWNYISDSILVDFWFKISCNFFYLQNISYMCEIQTLWSSNNLKRVSSSIPSMNGLTNNCEEPELHAHQKSFTIPAKQVICIQLGFCRKAEEMMKDSLKL